MELAHEWNIFKDVAERINFYLSNNLYREIDTFSIRSQLNSTVSNISRLLLEYGCPPNTIIFYDLPLDITGNRSTDSRWQDRDDIDDHWIISNQIQIWIAYRQDAAYFVVAGENLPPKNRFPITLSRGEEILDLYITSSVSLK